MEQTTSLKQSSRLSTLARLQSCFTSVLIGAVILSQGGCVPGPVFVSLDLTRIEATPHTAPWKFSEPNSVKQNLEVPDGSLPALAAKGIDDTRAAGLLEEARAELRSNRLRTLQRLTETLARTYLAQADVDARSRTVEAIASDLTRWESTINLIRELVNDDSAERGNLLIELSARVGFPDTGRTATARISGDPLLQFRQERIDHLRSRLKGIDENFEARLLAILAEYEAARVLDNGRLEAAARQSQELAFARAITEARELIDSTVVAEIEAPSDQRTALPPKPMVSPGNIGIAARPPDLSAPRPPSHVRSKYTNQDIKMLSRVYVTARGWKLANAGPGVRDVTQEFEEWLNNLNLGR